MLQFHPGHAIPIFILITKKENIKIILFCSLLFAKVQNVPVYRLPASRMKSVTPNIAREVIVTTWSLKVVLICNTPTNMNCSLYSQTRGLKGLA